MSQKSSRCRICWSKDNSPKTCGSWTNHIKADAMQKNIDVLNSSDHIVTALFKTASTKYFLEFEGEEDE